MKRLGTLLFFAWSLPSCAEPTGSNSDVTVCGAEAAPGFIGIEGLPPPVHRAEGEEATRLRELRAAAIAGEFGNLEYRGLFTPIEEPDGSQYKLYLRDVGAIEMPEGVPRRDPLAL